MIARARWFALTRLENEVLLVVRDARLADTERRLLILLHHDAHGQGDPGQFFQFSTPDYCRVLAMTRESVVRALTRCCALGWVERGPRTSRVTSVRLTRWVVRHPLDTRAAA